MESLSIVTSTTASLGTLRVDVLSSNQERDQGKSKTSFPQIQKGEKNIHSAREEASVVVGQGECEQEEEMPDIELLHLEALSVLQWHLVSEIRCEILRDFFRTEKSSCAGGGLELKNTPEDCEHELRLTSGILKLDRTRGDGGSNKRRTRRRDHGYLDGCFKGCKDADVLEEARERGQS